MSIPPSLKTQEFATRTNEDWRALVSLPNAGALTGAVARLMVKTEAASSDVMLNLKTTDAPARITLDATAKTLAVAAPQSSMSIFVPGEYVFDVVVDYTGGVVIVEANCKLAVIKGVTKTP